MNSMMEDIDQKPENYPVQDHLTTNASLSVAKYNVFPEIFPPTPLVKIPKIVQILRDELHESLLDHNFVQHLQDEIKFNIPLPLYCEMQQGLYKIILWYVQEPTDQTCIFPENHLAIFQIIQENKPMPLFFSNLEDLMVHRIRPEQIIFDIKLNSKEAAEKISVLDLFRRSKNDINFVPVPYFTSFNYSQLFAHTRNLTYWLLSLSCTELFYLFIKDESKCDTLLNEKNNQFELNNHEIATENFQTAFGFYIQHFSKYKPKNELVQFAKENILWSQDNCSFSIANNLDNNRETTIKLRANRRTENLHNSTSSSQTYQMMQKSNASKSINYCFIFPQLKSIGQNLRLCQMFAESEFGESMLKTLFQIESIKQPHENSLQYYKCLIKNRYPVGKSSLMKIYQQGVYDIDAPFEFYLSFIFLQLYFKDDVRFSLKSICSNPQRLIENRLSKIARNNTVNVLIDEKENKSKRTRKN